MNHLLYYFLYTLLTFFSLFTGHILHTYFKYNLYIRFCSILLWTLPISLLPKYYKITLYSILFTLQHLLVQLSSTISIDIIYVYYMLLNLAMVQYAFFNTYYYKYNHLQTKYITFFSLNNYNSLTQHIYYTLCTNLFHIFTYCILYIIIIISTLLYCLCLITFTLHRLQ